MTSVRLGNEYEQRLDRLAALTGRPKSFFIKKALEETLDDMEDIYTAISRLENPGERLSMSEMKDRLGLDR